MRKQWGAEGLGGGSTQPPVLYVPCRGLDKTSTYSWVSRLE